VIVTVGQDHQGFHKQSHQSLIESTISTCNGSSHPLTKVLDIQYSSRTVLTMSIESLAVSSRHTPVFVRVLPNSESSMYSTFDVLANCLVCRATWLPARHCKGDHSRSRSWCPSCQGRLPGSLPLQASHGNLYRK
jgi:hypothetical protein